MTETIKTGQMQMIPINLIDVLNPRERNKRVFEEIVTNIQTIGLKKPITVTPRSTPDGTDRYLLVCGEGRMKAFHALGETTIPALVIEVSDENAFIMSLTENIARLSGVNYLFRFNVNYPGRFLLKIMGYFFTRCFFR
ncbi:ParB N-terminal domain-containing protein [Methylomonas sp. MO1]|uniref:ParB N-terminal domain-containing protein n=1 Tax=Methylomonas sp. MO1 TaxID=3073619 RepID=UPI0028A56716|nr:ParB N-terminal domain-containing protein [Methylomonas sp. MO1]MDT4291218.1 ParB N-terminal domain-containing protein [Methylomonas sp. MO1]